MDANTVLGFEDDSREYGCVPAILEDLNVHSVRLLTNNPMKIDKLTALGVVVDGRIPVKIPSNPHSDKYLKVKASRMGHKYDL